MKPRVLIVDDDQAITQQLFWTLSDEYEVMIASDMQTAIRRVTIYEPDVSVLDLHLPPMSDSPEIGLRILKYIKSHLPDSRVLVMTAVTGIETIKACLAGGADEFLTKPFDIEHLLATMRRLAPRQMDVV